MSGMEDGAAELVGRMKHGALEYCALGLLRGGELGAFDLVRALAGAAGLAEREGPVYPVLARMRREGLIVTTWRDARPGRPSRFYRITDEGMTALDAFRAEWLAFRDRVDAFLGEESEP
jgi:PadR family transcriptional regulator PadR